MAAIKKIQPSWHAEEQPNATRLCREIKRNIRAALTLGTLTTKADIKKVMEQVLALDAAYPPLPSMLEKFPKSVEPASWWPSCLSGKAMEKFELHLGSVSYTPGDRCARKNTSRCWIVAYTYWRRCCQNYFGLHLKMEAERFEFLEANTNWL